MSGKDTAIATTMLNDLKERLKELRETEHYNALSVVNPDEWLEIAIALMQARSIRGMMNDLGVSQHSIYKINKQILDIKGKYQNYQIDRIDANIDAVDDLQTEGYELIRNEMWKLRDAQMADKNLEAERVKTLESLNKSLESMGKQAFVLQNRRERLSGKPDVTIEHKIFKGPEDVEALKQQLLAKKAEEASVIELEEEGGDAG